MKREILISDILRYKFVSITVVIVLNLTAFAFLHKFWLLLLVVEMCLFCLNPGHQARIEISKGEYRSVALKNKYLKVVFIDKKGLRAGNVDIPWSDIHIIEPVTFEYKQLNNGWYGMREVEMLCITKKETIDWDEDLTGQEVLLIQLSKKTYYSLCKYAKGKSLIVDKLLREKAYRYMDCGENK